MTKLSRKPISNEKLGHYLNSLWSAFTLMADKEQIRDLFRDLFTHTEYKMFAKRLQIARLLLEGETYEFIVKELNVSEKTVANVSNVLASRGEGFRNAHVKLIELEKKYQRKAEEKQNRVERKVRPRMAGEDALPELIKGGVLTVSKIVSRKIKQSSAKKPLAL